MPGLVWACRCVWHGQVPEYNPWTVMGGPLLSEGGGGTYPPTYLAYAVARHLLGDEFALMEVLAILHIVAGYAATYRAARRLGMGGLTAAAASLSYVLSGSILIMGRSWHGFVPLVLYMPLLIIAVTRAARGPLSWKWA